MKRRITAFSLAAAMLLLLPACSEEPVAPFPDALSQTSAEAVRPTPGEDFYGYVNFENIQNGQLPAGERRYSTYDRVEDKVDEELDEILDECISGKWKRNTPQQRIKDFYELMKDKDARDKQGVDLLKPGVGLIQDIKTMDDFIAASGTVYQMYGATGLFSFTVTIDYQNSSKNSLYYMGINTCGSAKEEFTDSDGAMDNIGSLVQDTLLALDVKEDEAKKRAADVYLLVKKIAGSGMSTVDTSDVFKIYNPYLKKEFAELFSNIDTGKLFEAFGFPNGRIIVNDPGIAKSVNEVLGDESNLEALKDYLLTCLVSDYRSALPPSYTKKMTASPEKSADEEKEVRDMVKGFLCDDFGVLYGKRVCTRESVEAAKAMLEDLRSAYRRMINKSERLSADSKEKFIKKLDNMVFLIGYDKNKQSIFDVVPASEGGSFLGTFIGAQQAAVARRKLKLNKKPDRYEWGMCPQEVNAQYNQAYNNVCLPATLLEPMYFDKDDEYKNLGKLGYTIAHEITHGFDSNGFRYDENGCVNDEWLSKEDREAYQKILDSTEEFYSNYKLLGIYNIKGDQTLSENIADLGAVQCICEVTDDKEKLRRIFEGVGEEWFSIEVVSAAVDHLYTDIHSPAEARVNAVVPNIDKFYEAYDIAETDRLYIAPEKRIRVW